MNRITFKMFLLLIFLVSVSVFISINRVVHSEALAASNNLCDWLADSQTVEPAPIGEKLRIRVEVLKEKYGQDTYCRVQRSSFNESFFETSVFVSSSNKDLLGLRFGLYTKFWSRSASIDYLGYWTPKDNS